MTMGSRIGTFLWGWFLLLCASSPSLSALPGPSGGDTTENTLRVSGTAARQVTPDVGSASVGTEVSADSPASAQGKVSRKLRRFLKEVKRRGTLKVETERVNLRPIRSREEGDEYEIVAYRASQRVRLEAQGQDQLEDLEQAIARAAELGLNQSGGVRFRLSSQARRDLESELYVEAARSALERGQRVLAALDLRFLEVRSISLGRSSPGLTRQVRARNMALESKAPSPVLSPGTQMVRVQVETILSYR
jgi:uncharacterized protein YggE